MRGIGLLLGTALAEAALVNQWTFDDGPGTHPTAVDSVGGKTGTLTNMEAGDWISSGLPPVPSGTSHALDFDGSNEFVVATGYKGITGTNARSVSAWIKGDKNNAAIISWGQDAGGKKWIFRVQDGNGTAGAIRVEVSGGYQVGNTDVRSTTTWHHVAAVLPPAGTPNVNQIRLYVDGVLEGISASKGKKINTASDKNVRIAQDHSNRHFDGLMDEVRIYNHGLSSAEVRALAGAPADLYSDAVLADGAIAFWRLGEDTGGKAFNEGSLLAAVDGSYSGVANSDKGVPGLLAASSNPAVHRDGSNDEVHVPNHGQINRAGAGYTTKSFELLFEADQVSGRQVLFEQGGKTNGFNLYLQDDELYFGAWTDNNFFSADTAASALDIVAGQTYHVAGLWDSGDLDLYVGGRPVDSATATFTTVKKHTGKNAIGGVRNDTRFHNATAGDGYNFAGIIDEVALYNLVLSEDQIRKHFLLSTPEPGTAVIWSLLGALGLGAGWRRRR